MCLEAAMSIVLQFCIPLTFVRQNQSSNVDVFGDHAIVVIAYAANMAINIAC